MHSRSIDSTARSRNDNEDNDNNDDAVFVTRWFVINIFCVVVSLLLLLDLVYAIHIVSERPFASSFTFVYDFTTTVIWCVEIAARVEVSRRSVEEPSRLTVCLTVAEVVVAAYFLWDSGVLLYEWRVRNEEILPQIQDAVFNLLAYLWLVVDVWRTRPEVPASLCGRRFQEEEEYLGYLGTIIPVERRSKSRI